MPTADNSPILSDIAPVPKRGKSADAWCTIGEIARRSGVAASALRFYETQGLIAGERTQGGHRQYPREILRRIGFIRAAQNVGLTLPEIAAALQTLPQGRTPTKADWSRLAKSWRPKIEKRIAALQLLSVKLDNCIGCGCLSLKACALYNPDDAAADLGRGARYLLGDKSSDLNPGHAPAGRPFLAIDSIAVAGAAAHTDETVDDLQLDLFGDDKG